VEEAGPARLSLSYVLSEPGDVRLDLVDDVGRTVVQLVDAEKPAGAPSRGAQSTRHRSRSSASGVCRWAPSSRRSRSATTT